MQKIRLVPSALKGSSTKKTIMRYAFFGVIAYLLFTFKDKIIGFVKQKFFPNSPMEVPKKPV